MKYNYLLLALATAALFSCSRNEVEDPDAGGVHVTIHAYQEGAIDTRTTLVDGGTQVYWEPSDEIKVFFRGSGSRFLSQNTANAQVTDFSGSLNVVVGINEGASGSNTLWGLYPYRADATSDGTSVTTTLPAEQTGRAGSFAKNTNITLAQSTSFDLAFYNVTGGIRFSLTQEGVKEVIFEGQNNENIAGKVKIAFADGVPTIQQVVEGQKTITLSAPNGGTFETGKWYYIVALPGTLSNGFKMTFNTDTQYATLKSSGSKTIKRGVFGSLADADEDLIYKDKGDEPPVTGNIEFADLAAKYACVAKFDTNGDGEVSIEEAEAATSFSGLFDNWKGVASFDEIRYFKNVHSLNGVFNGCNKLVSITIPENITDLGTSAFAGCSSLVSIVLPVGITAIGNGTFSGCSALSSISIPSTVTSIGQSAFGNCGLTQIIIPDNVTSIGRAAFDSCARLTSVYLPSGLSSIADYSFCYSGLVSIDIPSTVISIGEYAFKGCSSLSSVNLPSNLKTIKQYAFAEAGLSHVIVPDSVDSLGEYVFKGCSSLTTVFLPSGITSIPKGCFAVCNSLDSVFIPDGVTSVDSYAFDGVTMWKIELPSSITSLGTSCFGSIVCVILRSTLPISINNDTFHPLCSIFVPSNMIGLYSAMTNWVSFSSKLFPIDSFKEKSEFILVTSGEVEMGTSVNWAAYNVGATKPKEAGNYYAWGEKQTKSAYTWSTYSDSPGRDGQSFTKYFNGEGGKTRIDLEDDVAFISWGDNWRIPTDDEWTELTIKCGWERTEYMGNSGYLVYGFGSGNCIFLPSTGYRYGDRGSLRQTDRGCYWSSSLSGNDSYGKCFEFFTSTGTLSRGESRYYGLPVRPVCD